MEPVTVVFHPDAGPVVVQVRSGHATLGRFKVSFEEDFNWKPIGEGDLSDIVPDVFIVPVSGLRLKDRYVLIVGNYSSGDPLIQGEINVTYEITQQNSVIHSIPIREQRDGVLSAYHLLQFTTIDD
jgi:hypothetical protein